MEQRRGTPLRVSLTAKRSIVLPTFGILCLRGCMITFATLSSQVFAKERVTVNSISPHKLLSPGHPTEKKSPFSVSARPLTNCRHYDGRNLAERIPKAGCDRGLSKSRHTTSSSASTFEENALRVLGTLTVTIQGRTACFSPQCQRRP